MPKEKNNQEQGLQRRQENRPSLFSMNPLSMMTMSPFSLMRHMDQEMSRMFQGQGFMPQMEMFRREDQLVVRADLPGVSKEDINVELEGDVLTLEGQRKFEHEDKQDGFYRSECSYGTFRRSIALPEGVDAEQCKSSFKDGVLEICFPAPKEKQSAKRIEIE